MIYLEGMNGWVVGYNRVEKGVDFIIVVDFLNDFVKKVSFVYCIYYGVGCRVMVR